MRPAGLQANPGRRRTRLRGNLLRKELSSMALRAREGFDDFPGRRQPAEFVTNSTSYRGGAVSRPHGCILKTCPAPEADPCLAGLYKNDLVWPLQRGESRNRAAVMCLA